MRTILARSMPLCGLLTALSGGAVRAEELPRSAACHTALQALEAAEDVIAATAPASAAAASDLQRQRVVAARLQPLRKRVADDCLGALTTSPPPSQHTWVVPPLPIRPGPAATPPPATPAVTVPQPRLEPLVTVTQCTAAACITSDGSTLIRMGPTLVGPHGACTVQGNFVRCP
ncbi:MAG TPA: hypothetical protein VGF12_02065 [Roseateles sp.]|uniref:hypothetical protein n=1 Tax=Roseateles sp. TaxID=1971397 RepID=UPI002ED9AE59